MLSEQFYAGLPAIDAFADLIDPARYAELPDDWSVVIADVRGSTQAIREGRYKEVNVVGVSVITSVVNAAKPVEIPYLFGGDGASLCVPESRLPGVREALSATKRMALEAYGLELRTGVVPVPVIRQVGHRVLVARQRLSPKCSVAVFAGEGILFAEERVKNPATQDLHEIKGENPGVQADSTGLECRWRPIPSPRGDTVSLIVKAVAGSARERADIYRELFAVIERVYGVDEARRPVSLKGLKLTITGRGFWPEVKLKSFGKSRSEQLACWLNVWALTCLVADYNGAHLHFLDGSDGGYAMAAVQMKEQLKRRAALSAGH